MRVEWLRLVEAFQRDVLRTDPPTDGWGRTGSEQLDEKRRGIRRCLDCGRQVMPDETFSSHRLCAECNDDDWH